MTNRRHFLGALASTSAALVLTSAGEKASPMDQARFNPRHIPRWRGFNLQGRFAMPGQPYSGPAFDEFDFSTMAEWGFDFARLPLSYWACLLYTSPSPRDS